MKDKQKKSSDYLKWCINCQHCKNNSTWYKKLIGIHDYQCYAPEIGYNMVTGEKKHYRCWVKRHESHFMKSHDPECGIDGKWFKSK